MQPVARVAQYISHLARVKAGQLAAKVLAHRVGGRKLFTRFERVVLPNVVMLQLRKPRYRVIQASRSHAPRANRRAHQMHVMACLRQPIAKNKPIQRPKYQTLGATRRAWHHPNVLRLQAVLGDVPHGFRACVNAEGLHSSDLRGQPGSNSRLNRPEATAVLSYRLARQTPTIAWLPACFHWNVGRASLWGN